MSASPESHLDGDDGLSVGAPTARGLLLFAGLFLPATMAVIGLAAGRTLSWRVAWVVWGLGAVLTVAALARPVYRSAIYDAAAAVTTPIGRVVSLLLLALAYYGVVTPVGSLMRLFGRDTMGRSRDRSASSYWAKRPAAHPPERYFRQF